MGIRADVQGSAEAISSALNQLVAEDDRCKTTVRILSSGVGDVTASDVNLAHVSKAEIIAFNVAANMQAQEEVRKTAVDITYETVIYDILDMLEVKLQKILSPTPEGELIGSSTVKAVFEIGKFGKVAGCEVTEGKMVKGATVRILRGSEILFEGPLKTLRNVKTDVNEMEMGQECGMSFRGYEDYQPGDVVECYMAV